MRGTLHRYQLHANLYSYFVVLDWHQPVFEFASHESGVQSSGLDTRALYMSAFLRPVLSYRMELLHCGRLIIKINYLL
jgi:hypothetical protein